jgi:hypothetical protein
VTHIFALDSSATFKIGSHQSSCLDIFYNLTTSSYYTYRHDFVIILQWFLLTLHPGYTLNTRNMAISAAMVLPDPVGAPSNTLLSVWYRQWNICVWIGLKCSNGYNASNLGSSRALTGNGCSSNKSTTKNKETVIISGRFFFYTWHELNLFYVEDMVQELWEHKKSWWSFKYWLTKHDMIAKKMLKIFMAS